MKRVVWTISDSLGQSIVVDNRGGGGAIAAEMAVRANPDGCTLIMISGRLNYGSAGTGGMSHLAAAVSGRHQARCREMEKSGQGGQVNRCELTRAVFLSRLGEPELHQA